MSLDWEPPNYIPPELDYSCTQSDGPYRQHDTRGHSGLSWRLLDTTGFKICAVLGMAWVAFMCFEAYHSAPVHSPYIRHPAHVSTHRSAHRKD